MANIRPITVTDAIADVSTAETLLIPVTANMVGELKQVKTCLGGAITVADTKVIVSKNTTALGTITVAYTSSAAGDIDTLDLAGVYLSVGDYIKIAGDGGSTDAARLGIAIDIMR